MNVRANRVSWVLAAVGMVAGVGAAVAGPLDRSVVPADPALVVHVDMEQATRSEFGRFLIEQRANISALAGMDGLRVFGIDPFKDFKSVTIATPKDSPDAGVVVLRSTAAVDGLWNHLKTEPHAKPMTVGGHEIMSWEDSGKRKYGVVRKGASDAERVVYVCDSWEVLSRALDVAVGKAPADKGPADGAGSAVPRAGSIVFVDLRQKPADMGKPDDIPGLAMFGGLQRGVVDLGDAESGGGVQARVSLVYDGDQTAADMKQVGEGMKALARLAARNAPQVEVLAAAAEPVEVKASGAELILTGRWPQEQARGVARALMGKPAEPVGGKSGGQDAGGARK